VERLLTIEVSDIFLKEGEVPWAREHSKVSPSSEDPLSREDLEAFWKSCGADPERDYEKDARYTMPGGKFLRVNLYRTMGRLAAAIRPIKEVIPLLSELGAPAGILQSWMDRRSGIILITGATGSGKSTTVASCLDALNRRTMKHVVTIEDPVEYIFQNQQCIFSQREVNSDSGEFAEALKSALRQNPDVIFVGEIRDEETAQIALRAAETGHLVISTLHSAGVVESMERITNLFPPDRRSSALLLLSMQLIGIVSQQLLPHATSGLYLVSEHMQNEGATRKWIKEGSYTDMAAFLRRQESEKNCDMLTALVQAFQTGNITEPVARQAAQNPNDFNRVIRGIS